MKTFNREDIISWSNSEDAKKYVEQLVYLGNSYQELITKVKENSTSTLWYVFSAEDVNCVFEDVHGVKNGLLLPTDKVREVDENDIFAHLYKVKEKRYRPFKSMEEFIKTIGDIGTIITYRTKKKILSKK